VCGAEWEFVRYEREVIPFTELQHVHRDGLAKRVRLADDERRVLQEEARNARADAAAFRAKATEDAAELHRLAAHLHALLQFAVGEKHNLMAWNDLKRK
jgi:hypothetical protein